MITDSPAGIRKITNPTATQRRIDEILLALGKLAVTMGAKIEKLAAEQE